MSSPTQKKIRKATVQLLVYVLVLFVLLLTFVNIQNFFGPKKILGIETEAQNNNSQNEDQFWSDFLIKNPNYIPGWIAVGREDQVKNIDPNFK
jgi:cytoskeletal protein RodZ